MPEKREFEIGLVMAGAISAGAYSAGVVDFLFEALDAYEEAKSLPGWTGPTHTVRLPVIAGASAGGMTAGLAALHAFHDLQHVWPGEQVPPPPANRLYSSWVTDVSIERLLETSDLADGREAQGVGSLLCCDVLDEILKNAFSLAGMVRTRPWIGRGEDRSLAVLLTVTNLRGVPYSFKVFGTDSPKRYGTLNHGDYFNFRIGTSVKQIDAAHALDITATSGAGWDLFKTTVLATGAYPIGLLPRRLQRPTRDYRESEQVVFESLADGIRIIPPDDSIYTAERYAFVSVDGGTIDNEPLELARRYLAGLGNHNERDGVKANKAIVLVAPFPNFVQLPDYDDQYRLVHIIPELATTLMQQARFKPEELAAAEDETIFSRFIISPIRPGNGTPLAKLYPIAGGTLGGFGGFIHQSFRRHDYLLGRRNAQAFLRWSFALPESNLLFNEFQGDRERWYVPDAAGVQHSIGSNEGHNLPKKRFASTTGSAADAFGFPIIPLTDKLREPIEIDSDDLPQPDRVHLGDLKAGIEARADLVVKTLVDVDLRWVTEGHITGPLLREGARVFATKMVTQKALEAVESAVNDAKLAFAIR